MAENKVNSVKVGIGMGFRMEDHDTLLYEELYFSLLSKPLLMDHSLEREKTERWQIQWSFPDLRDLSVVERSCTCCSIRRSFLGMR